MKINLYSDNEKLLWQQYLENHPDATFFHTIGWKNAVSRTFKHSDVYLYASDNDKITGILPMVRIKSKIFANALISLPFAVYGGVLADNGEIEKELINSAIELGRKQKINYLELRHLKPAAGKEGLINKDLYMTFDLELHTDSQVNWDGMKKRNRNILRKGINSGLQLYRQPEWGKIDREELKIFYNLFARTQTSLGTPVLPWSWFVNLTDTFSQDTALFSTVYKDKIINSLMVFKFKDTLLPYYIGYDPAYLQFAPNNYILWEAIKAGCAQGFKHFDLGRSRQGSGSFEFKRHWGIEPKPLFYQYYLYEGNELPNFSPSNAKFSLAKDIWTHLPLPIAKLIGPHLVKYLG